MRCAGVIVAEQVGLFQLEQVQPEAHVFDLLPVELAVGRATEEVLEQEAVQLPARGYVLDSSSPHR